MEQKAPTISLHKPNGTGYRWENRLLCSGFGTWGPRMETKVSLTIFSRVPTRHLLCIGRFFHPWLPARAAPGGIFGLPTQSFSEQIRGEKSKGHFASLVPRRAQPVMSVGLLRIQFHAEHAYNYAA